MAATASRLDLSAAVNPTGSRTYKWSTGRTARIKTGYGASGSVSGMTFEDNSFSSISKYGVVVQQGYKNGSPTGKPTNGIKVKYKLW